MEDNAQDQKMKYSLTVTATVQNLNFASQMKEYNERGRFGMTQDHPYPEPAITVKHLEVVLSEVQFAAVKRSVLEVF